jgi:hypothetical protein
MDPPQILFSKIHVVVVVVVVIVIVIVIVVVVPCEVIPVMHSISEVIV